MATKQKEIQNWDLDKSHFPFETLKVSYEEPIGVMTVEVYGFDGNGVDVSGDSIRDETYKENYPWLEKILQDCNIINS